MALASKKTGTIHGKSGGNKDKLKAKFDGGALDHLSDNPDDFPQHAAILYAMQNITEDIDSLRTYAGTEIRTAVAANTAKVGITSTQAGHITANNDKVSNLSQTKRDIDGLGITTVGTIDTGVWEGTTIKTAYIGDDQITEDKLANTLLAEIDANTAKNTNVVGNLGVVANGTSLTITTANGSNIAIPAATTSAWGIMTDDLVSAIAANTAKVTNSDQSKADINALDITEVGTISSGVWQGTTIKTAYIGDDQITEDKLANTLLAEIDANTAKVTNSDQSKSDIDGLGITTVGTIDTGVWQGTTIKTAYIGDDQITEDKLANTLLAEIDANTAKVTNSNQSKADINALDITEVGTISSGVWQGTAIASGYIADDAITEDKLANTLLAEIDANTAKTVLTIGTRSTEAKAGNTTTISSSQASAITANTSKVGTETDLAPTTDDMTLAATVAENRGTYTLTFTVTHGRVTKTANITMG